jgi:hypothetical protein
MAYFEQISINDGTTLYTGTIAATGAGSSISTQFYNSVTVQVTGAGYGTINIEGSNDGTNWSIIKLLPSGDVALIDSITASDEIYTFKVSTLYIRYNVQQYSGTLNLIIAGRSSNGPDAADNLAYAFNPDTPLFVRNQNKTDNFGALILSDAPAPVVVNAVVGTIIFIDMQGYNTIALTAGVTFAATNGFQISNDQVNWTVAQASIASSSSTAGIYTTGIFPAASFTLSNAARFVRIICTTAGSVTYYLRNTAGIMSSQNLTAINGIGIQTPGSAALAPPIPVGIIDYAGLTRRFLSDTAGRATFTAASPLLYTMAGTTTTTQNTPSSNTALPHNSIGMLPYTYQLTGAMNVQDTSQFEGQNFVELLAQILLEMRIMNQQLYELPRLMATSQQSQDPPESFRQEPSIFNQ